MNKRFVVLTKHSKDLSKTYFFSSKDRALFFNNIVSGKIGKVYKLIEVKE